MLIGFAGVSTVDKILDAQVAALEVAECTMIRPETGTSLNRNPELGIIFDFIHQDETLVVTHIDRVARSLRGFSGHCRDAQGERRPSRRHRTAIGHF